MLEFIINGIVLDLLGNLFFFRYSKIIASVEAYYVFFVRRILETQVTLNYIGARHVRMYH